jgi:hypothetical protein
MESAPLILIAALALAACGKAVAPEDGKRTTGFLHGDADERPDDNPMCRLFSAREAGAYAGETLKSGENAGMGSGCRWPAIEGKGNVMVVAIPSDYAERPSTAPGYTTVSGIGEDAFIVPERGGFAAGATVGLDFIKVSVAGKEASAGKALTLLRETIKRRS